MRVNLCEFCGGHIDFDAPLQASACTYCVPARSTIDKIQVGSLVTTVLGDQRPVVEIFARGVDLRGRAYVCLYVAMAPGSKMSQSFKEGERIRTLGQRKGKVTT